ncbi:hypothetical protein L1987_64889 [Smallanthus sonchifolius]|uniref:Uncharacterized protein n=1 Tax=Smallanthus sonchifolius TaxID=185202 RepID=A0ACB9BSZ2_9ASTR|nr:hypothetical protein L1987_64889 [Smallanthus sonchifolius]
MHPSSSHSSPSNYPMYLHITSNWGWRVSYKGDKWAFEKLEVFVVPHSHNKPRWKLTVEEYYDRRSRRILDTIVETLSKNGQLEIVGGCWVMNDEDA